ncbi:MAG: MFS transporter [Candidatus Thermoplasmatota archaeon]|nr:MFS transporter [Candidatus Thermoplasmatota archaeon]
MAVASASFFFSYYSRLSWSVLVVYMPFHPDVGQEALAFALFFAGYALVQLPAGFLSDRYSGGKIVFLALIGLAISTLTSGLSVNVTQEYASSLAMGLTAGWIYPASINIMRTYYASNLTLSIGYYSIAWPLAIIVTGLALPWIAIHYGWQWGYYTTTAGSLMVAVMSLKLDTERRIRRINFRLLGNPNLIMLSVGGFLFFLSYWSITLYAYGYFVGIGVNGTLAGLIFSAMAAAGIPATIFSGKISNRIGARNTLIISLLVYGGMVAMISVAYGAMALIAISLIMGFFRFLITPGNSDMAARIGGNEAASASGISNMFWQTSGIIGPIFSAVIIDMVGFRRLWLVMFVLILLASFFYAGIRTAKPQVDAAA